MLRIIRSMSEMDFEQLMVVYTETNLHSGKRLIPFGSEYDQNLYVHQDFYRYLLDFFKDPCAFYAVWICDRQYKAALRIEQYRDGFLLCALETAPPARRRGYATALIKAVLAYLAQREGMKVYAHVDKRNIASLSIHASCGFKRILDHAVYIDGSVLQSSCTLLWN